MPFLEHSSYKPPFIFRNRHLNTMYPSLFREVQGVNYTRERIETPDDDFFDLDWSKVGGDRLVIVLHGLEGSADRPYVRGIIKIMNDHGWDGVGFNFRGCSGTPNRQIQSYHSGKTDDLDLIIQKVKESGSYRSIAIVGFSLGGNVTLKYVGERGSALDPLISHAVGISVPCHLASGSGELQKWHNSIYMKRFLETLKEKVVEKEDQLKGILDLEKVAASKDFFDFDGLVTAPINGFKSAMDYYDRSSSKQFLHQITIPTLMINALDDSFLADLSYPAEIAKNHTCFHLETPRYGGHVGFVTRHPKSYYYTEQRVLQFLTIKPEELIPV